MVIQGKYKQLHNKLCNFSNQFQIQRIVQFLSFGISFSRFLIVDVLLVKSFLAVGSFLIPFQVKNLLIRIRLSLLSLYWEHLQVSFLISLLRKLSLFGEVKVNFFFQEIKELKIATFLYETFLPIMLTFLSFLF